MDRGIECTSALRIRTWEIGTAGTTRRMGSVGRDASYVPSSTPVQTPSWRYVATYLRTFLLRAQLARATRGGARVLLADCSETVASHTHGRVGRRA